eukprot:4763009-Amphidinium_carterae.1
MSHMPHQLATNNPGLNACCVVHQRRVCCFLVAFEALEAASVGRKIMAFMPWHRLVLLALVSLLTASYAEEENPKKPEVITDADASKALNESKNVSNLTDFVTGNEGGSPDDGTAVTTTPPPVTTAEETTVTTTPT